MLEKNCCHFFPDVLFQIHRCPWFLFVHLAIEIFSDKEVLRLGTLVPMNIEFPTEYQLSQDRIVVFEIRLHSKIPMLYRPALHGNWNALSLARRALKDKFLTPTVPLTTVLQNRQVFLPDPVYNRCSYMFRFWLNHHQGTRSLCFAKLLYWYQSIYWVIKIVLYCGRMLIQSL
jgi:hypothetical protein